MKSDAEKLLARASECLEEANQLFNFGHFLGSINRAYYCIFGCARALLYEHELYAKTHQGIQSKFNELFIKTGLFERKHGEAMRHVFDLRQTGDYDLDAALTEEDAAFAIQVAEAFLENTQAYLKL
jgi:uncharacterized protein (UPF0332 family)